MLRRLEWSSRFRIRLFITIIFVLFTTFTLYGWKDIASRPRDEILPLPYDLSTPISNDEAGKTEASLDTEVPLDTGAPVNIEPPVDIEAPMNTEAPVNTEAYREVFSVSTPDQKYFLIDFVDYKSINPNIIPHPFLKDTWVIVAQRDNFKFKDQTLFVELGCTATFQRGVLKCTQSPIDVPIAPTPGNNCKGDLAWFRYSKGPHDARVFYGPKAPYTIYGSNSDYTCFGQFVQDFRSLMEWGNATVPHPWYENGTELQRPGAYGPIEKNYFMFWDKDGQAYAHYDVSPQRAFAKLGSDGSVGEDLAPQAAANDDKCMAKYMPKVRIADEQHEESIHQATNSLSVTLCKRSDPSCSPNDSNTFIFTIFQWKSYYGFHSNYEPYPMLFEQKAPFSIHGISKKPFWIHGRRTASIEAEEKPKGIERRNNGKKPWNATEMMYIVSVSWKSHEQTYHGYLDDVVFLAFGIEDGQSAGIDVVIGDLLMDMGHCGD